MKQSNLSLSPQNQAQAALLQNPEALKALLASPDAQRLIQLLGQQNGSQLQQAAQQAKEGNPSALSAMVAQLAKSPQGKVLVERLEGQVK